MSEGTKAIIASVVTIGVALVAAIWMSRIGAWGPAVYTLVLAGVVVWLVASEARHAHSGRIDEESLRRSDRVYWN